MSGERQTETEIQGRLWSMRARDWAELQESQHRPKYEDAVQRLAIGPGRMVLDLGCGAGTFCRLAADTGATVTGIDAAAGLVEIARERVPEGRFDVGDIRSLPYEDGAFDRATAFNSLQFVAEPSAVLAEVRRVTKPAATVYILVWGRQEHTDLVAVLKGLHPLAPPRPPGSPGAFALSRTGVLEELLTTSGFTVREAGYIELPYAYPDRATMLRALCSSAPAVLAADTSGETRVRAAIIAAVGPYRTAAGGYRFQTEYRYVTATRLPDDESMLASETPRSPGSSAPG